MALSAVAMCRREAATQPRGRGWRGVATSQEAWSPQKLEGAGGSSPGPLEAWFLIPASRPVESEFLWS